MDVAHHAVARRNRACEFVANGVPGFPARNRRIVRSAESTVAERSVLRRMRCCAVVCVDDMTRRAAAGAVIARLAVRARQGKQRIEQARLLQSEKNRISAELCAEAARAELVVR